MTAKRTLRPEEAIILRHVHHNIRLGVPQVRFHLQQQTPVAFCAGGPSLLDHLDVIRRLQMEGAEVVCVGNAANTVRGAGIKVNGHIMLDGAGRNRDFVLAKDQDCRYFVASQCDPAVFEALRDHQHVYIWHCGGLAEEWEILRKHYGPDGYFIVPGGSYVSLRAITLLRILGYRWLHVFGLDSCLREDEHHAYAQPNADGQRAVRVNVADRDFLATGWMLDQAEQFIDSIKAGRFGNAELAVHGDGLIAHMIKSGSETTWQRQ